MSLNETCFYSTQLYGTQKALEDLAALMMELPMKILIVTYLAKYIAAQHIHFTMLQTESKIQEVDDPEDNLHLMRCLATQCF